METKITATQLARSMSDILNRVKYRGEKFIIERNGEPVAILEPAAPAKSITWREFIDHLQNIPHPDETFADDLDEIHSSQPPARIPEWPQ